MRCSEDVKRTYLGSSYVAPCHNPAEFEVRAVGWPDGTRPLGACRHHLAPLTRRILAPAHPHGRGRARYTALDVRLVDLDA